MKEILIGIALIVLLGFGSLLYNNARNVGNDGEEVPFACTADAKICPNGTGVGRSGPECTFDPCPSDRVSYDAPVGYMDSLPLLSSMVLGRVGFYTKEPTTISNSITVYVFEKGEKTFEDIVLENVVYSPSDIRPESLDEFEQVTVGDREVYQLINERFEATVEITYALNLEEFAVLVVHRDISVENWMEDFTLEELEDLKVAEDVVASVSLN